MIRATRKGDHARLLEICRAAFAQEDLVPLVNALLADEAVVSLTTETRDGPIALLMLTPCSITAGPDDGAPPPPLETGTKGGKAAYLLGPVAVMPEQQNRGHGTKLVADALGRIATRPGKPPVLVLGDPNFYSRFGFQPEPNTVPPYSLPAEWDGAWQSISFDRQPLPRGVLHVPAAWAKAALWTD